MSCASRLALSCICAALSPIALAHDEPAKEYGRLGTVKFENSCAPEVQAKLTRAVAMLHSFWYVAAEDLHRGDLGGSIVWRGRGSPRSS
jgi:hypothetical protein